MKVIVIVGIATVLASCTPANEGMRVQDAGSFDAESQDMGLQDAGLQDAGLRDGGTRADAGQEVDPCVNVTCGISAICRMETGECLCLDGTEGDPLVECLPPQALQGFIGSPCSSDLDCPYDQGFCLPDTAGYPQGTCSQACTRLCPDQDGHPVTFCIADPDNTRGICVSRCDTELYPDQGCRAEYQCLPWRRNTEAGSVRNTCVPAQWEPTEDCSDPGNLADSDECYFELVSFAQPDLELLARYLLQGTASPDQARTFLDRHYEESQRFVQDELGVRIYDNYTAGHHPSRPMVGMIVHYTANQREDPTIRYFVGSSPHASTHFVVGSVRNGLVVQIFSHENRTWHAGSAYNIDRFGFDFANAGYLEPDGAGGWMDYADRAYTINLPLHGSEPIQVTGGIPGAEAKYARKEQWQPYTYYQLLSYIMVTRALHLVYGLQADKIERHGDVSSSRIDPGAHFPHRHLKALVFDNRDVFTVSWLMDYKVQANWIAEHPEAR